MKRACSFRPPPLHMHSLNNSRVDGSSDSSMCLTTSILVKMRGEYSVCVCACVRTCVETGAVAGTTAGEETHWGEGGSKYLLRFRECFVDRKSLPIAKNHPKTSQEFSEQFGGLLHIKCRGFSKNWHAKVHPNFARNLGRQTIGNTFSGPQNAVIMALQHAIAPLPCTCSCKQGG